MRKKWLCLLILPFVLFGAVIWTREAAWNRMEADFRRDFMAESIEWSSHSSASVDLREDRWARGYPKLIGQWNDKELEEALAEVHLMPSPSEKDSEFVSDLYWLVYGSEMSAAYGFFIEIGRDKGGFGFSSSKNYEKWHGLELTPESCRALKRRIEHFKNELSDHQNPSRKRPLDFG